MTTLPPGVERVEAAGKRPANNLPYTHDHDKISVRIHRALPSHPSFSIPFESFRLVKFERHRRLVGIAEEASRPIGGRYVHSEKSPLGKSLPLVSSGASPRRQWIGLRSANERRQREPQRAPHHDLESE